MNGLNILAIYNKQRDKSHSERLREACAKLIPDEAYERLLIDRAERRQVDIKDNITLGDYKGRCRRITTFVFLRAAKKAIDSEKEYWPLTVRRVHYLLLNDPPFATIRNQTQHTKMIWPAIRH